MQAAAVYLDHADEDASKQAIREASPTWSLSQWEQYLQSLEVGLKESQPASGEIDKLAIVSNIFDLAPTASSKELTRAISKMISELTQKQMLVIRNFFFEGRSERQIAKMMAISRASVVDLKKRAIRQMQKNASKHLSTIPLQVMQNFKSFRNIGGCTKKGGSSC